MATSVAQMKASIQAWALDSIDDALLTDAIGDAIDSLWNSMMLVTLERLLKGPVTVSFASGSDLVDLTAGSNPTVSADDIAYIRHLTITTSQGQERTLSQSDIDSALMRRYGSQISSASDFQNYAFDLINGSQVRIKPKLGTTFTAGYFFVLKPSRTADPMPFNQPGSTAFIRFYALSRIKAAWEEYASADSWEKQADKERMGIMLALSQENRGKDNTIRPFMS